MPVLREWDLIIDVDQVLRGQGADPEVIHRRSPNLIDLAERAIREGTSLLKPQLMYRRLAVERVLHERIILDCKVELRGRYLVQHLASATEVLVILCTIGDDLEKMISETMPVDPTYALALDGLGSAGVETLANAACCRFESEAKEMHLETSVPISPGMLDWSVEEGQHQIFKLLHAEEIGVQLTPSWIMLPRKSLSMVLGIGERMTQAGTTCDYCSMREHCRYRTALPE